RNPHQARDALGEIVRIALRYLGVVALAACSRGGCDALGGDPIAVALVRELRRRDLTDEEWLDLVGALVRPQLAMRDSYPIPELVDAVSGSPAALGELLAARAGDATATAEISVRDRLLAHLPRLARLLRALEFLTDYQLVVPRATGGELWMGPRRSDRPVIAIAPGLPPGLPILVDFDGRPVLQLAPLIQVAAPTPGAAEELFLFHGGRGELDRGARLVAAPHGFERLDATVWDWFRAHLLALDDAAPVELEQGPYRGLLSFTESDAEVFFGRERAADAFVNQLLLQPLIAVVGPSGAGKSSVVHAGGLPRLPPGWRTVVLRPGAAPLAMLVGRAELATPATADAPAIAAALHARAADRTLVVVVDQFEEVFTQCRDPAERTRFADALVQAVSSVDDRVRVILTVRDDFLARAGELAPLRDRLAHGLTLLPTPAPDDLVRVLIEPARRVGYRFDDPELPHEMVRAVANRPGALALLSFTAARLWELRDRHFHQLTRKAHDAIGGVEGALAGHAEATLLACSTDQQRLVREVFRHLVTSEGARTMLGRDELVASLGAGHGAAVIERLVAARLLVVAESTAGEERIEIVHEALLTSWPRLVEWRREDVEGARLRDQLRAAAEHWHDRGRPRGLLWRGDPLDDYRRWRKRWAGAVPATALAFATASLHDEARGRRIRRAIAACAVSLLVAGVAALSVLYRSSRHHADTAQGQLLASFEEQGRRLLLDGEYLRALPYLAEAYAQGDRSTAVRFLLARAERLARAELAVHVHAGVPRGAAFRNGSHILSVSDSGEAAIWDAATGGVVAALPGRAGGPYYAKVSRDGSFAAIPLPEGVALWDGDRTRMLAAGHAERIAIDAGGGRIAVAIGDELSAWTTGGEALWTASTGSKTIVATWSGDAIVTLGVDHAARIVDRGGVLRIATRGPVDAVIAGANGAIATVSGTALELWDPGGARRAAIEERSPIASAALSPDGQLIAVGSSDGTVRLYDAATQRPSGELVGHRGKIATLQFSDDSARLATAGPDLAVRIWDVAGRRPIASLLGARDQYLTTTLPFDAAGKRVVGLTLDGTVRVFATDDPDVETTVDAGEDIDTGQFFDEGRRIATSSAHAVQLWSTATGALLARFALPGGLARISPDGTRLAIVLSSAPHAEIRSAITGELLARLGRSATFRWASFDQASERVVTASSDHLVELWSARGERLATLRGHGDEVLMAAFGPGDRQIVSASADFTARIWDTASGREVARVAGGDFMASAELDRTGRLLTGNSDRIVRLWDAGTASPLRSFEHAAQVRFAAVSPDGTLVAGATSDGTVSVWDTASSSVLAEFHHAASAESVAFAPDGARLLSTSADHRAVVWRTDIEIRSHSIVTAFVHCHAPYRLVETRLEMVIPTCRGDGS
ncbi:MAG TPA: WD40 repeat domain-containing protein, partial [Kofleriaceae bacterium]